MAAAIEGSNLTIVTSIQNNNCRQKSIQQARINKITNKNAEAYHPFMETSSEKNNLNLF